MTDSSRPLLPDSDLVSSVPESVTADTEREDTEREERDLSHLPDEHRDALRRLHRRIEQAAETIKHLRAENEHLRRRVQELEARPTLPDDKTVLTLDDDPEALRDRITAFIDALDTYLDATAPDEDSDEEID